MGFTVSRFFGLYCSSFVRATNCIHKTYLIYDARYNFLCWFLGYTQPSFIISPYWVFEFIGFFCYAIRVSQESLPPYIEPIRHTMEDTILCMWFFQVTPTKFYYRSLLGFRVPRCFGFCQ